MFLTNDEIIELTGRTRCDAQKKQLLMMGIEHKSRADGSLAILRSHVEQEFSGIVTPVKKQFKHNFEALNAAH